MQRELNNLWYYVHNYSFDQLMSMAKPHVNKLCHHFVKTMGDNDEATKKVAELICTPLYIDRQITRNETRAFTTLFPGMAKLSERGLANFIAGSARINPRTFIDFYRTLPNEVRYHATYVAICILGTDSNLETSEYSIICDMIYGVC